MIPAAADFGVIAFDRIGVRLTCPECGTWVDPDHSITLPDIRDIIAAASSHAVNAHRMSAPATIQGA